MREDLAKFLDTLFESGRDHDAGEASHARRRLNLEPETARLVVFLLRAVQAKRIIEIGTSNGYGTIWLAWALEPFGGHVVTVERDAGKSAEAAENLTKAGLGHLVELKVGEATDVVRGLDGPFDAVLFDADRTSAPEQLGLLLPKLRPGALILADNALSHPDEIADYLRVVEALPGSQNQIVPVGKGLSVSLAPFA